MVYEICRLALFAAASGYSYLAKTVNACFLTKGYKEAEIRKLVDKAIDDKLKKPAEKYNTKREEIIKKHKDKATERIKSQLEKQQQQMGS